MRLEILKKVNANCYVKKIGYIYPIRIYNRRDYNQACVLLEKHPSFKEPAKPHHFSTYREIHVSRRFSNQNIEQRKWFAGRKKWGDKRILGNDFWIVFKTEKDRTLAMMLLGGK